MFHASPCPTGVALGVQAAQRSRLQADRHKTRGGAIQRTRAAAISKARKQAGQHVFFSFFLPSYFCLVRFDTSCAPIGLARGGCRLEHGLVARLQPLALRAGHVATLLLDPPGGSGEIPFRGGAAVLLPARRAPAALVHTTSHITDCTWAAPLWRSPPVRAAPRQSLMERPLMERPPAAPAPSPWAPRWPSPRRRGHQAQRSRSGSPAEARRRTGAEVHRCRSGAAVRGGAEM